MCSIAWKNPLARPLVNSMHVRRFLRRKAGKRWECEKSTGTFKQKLCKKRPVANALCPLDRSVSIPIVSRRHQHHLALLVLALRPRGSRGNPSARIGDGGPKQNERKTDQRIYSCVDDDKSPQESIAISRLVETATRCGTGSRRIKNHPKPDEKGDESHQEKSPPDKHPEAARSSPGMIRSVTYPRSNYSSNRARNERQNHWNTGPVPQEKRSVQPQKSEGNTNQASSHKQSKDSLFSHSCLPAFTNLF